MSAGRVLGEVEWHVIWVGRRRRLTVGTCAGQPGTDAIICRSHRDGPASAPRRGEPLRFPTPVSAAAALFLSCSLLSMLARADVILQTPVVLVCICLYDQCDWMGSFALTGGGNDKRPREMRAWAVQSQMVG